jgi:hypothetical protein
MMFLFWKEFSVVVVHLCAPGLISLSFASAFKVPGLELGVASVRRAQTDSPILRFSQPKRSGSGTVCNMSNKSSNFSDA